MWPWSTIRRLKERAAYYEVRLLNQRETITDLKHQRDLLLATTKRLRDDLALAQKNDNRDPKTGRFVRREADHIDE